MQWLARVCVERPVLASVLMLVIVVLGVIGYRGLGVDQFPNVDIPVVVVTTTLPGAAPEEVESDVTDKIEAAVNQVSGVDELNSVSSEGVSQVIIRFALDADQAHFVALVRRRRALLVFHATLGTGARTEVANVAGLAVLIDAALHAAMKGPVTTRQPSSLAVDVRGAFEA